MTLSRRSIAVALSALYLLKGLKRVELMAALRTVAEGEMLLEAKNLTRVLRGVSENSACAPQIDVCGLHSPPFSGCSLACLAPQYSAKNHFISEVSDDNFNTGIHRNS